MPQLGRSAALNRILLSMGGTQSCGEGGAKLPTFNRSLPVAELTQCCMTPQKVVQITRVDVNPCSLLGVQANGLTINAIFKKKLRTEHI